MGEVSWCSVGNEESEVGKYKSIGNRVLYPLQAKTKTSLSNRSIRKFLSITKTKLLCDHQDPAITNELQDWFWPSIREPELLSRDGGGNSMAAEGIAFDEFARRKFPQFDLSCNCQQSNPIDLY